MELKEQLKAMIIEALNLEDITPNDIEDDMPLFGEDGLGLDSIDGLELIVLLEKHFGIKIKDAKKGKEVFKNIETMATFVEENRTE